jgi:hypothetical protein
MPGAGPTPLISGTGAGTCHATLTLASGQTYSTVISFGSQWAACGDDPHGCGEQVESDAGDWFIDNPCEEASSPDAMPDSAAGDAHD